MENYIEGSWKELKGKVKQAWGKLTDDDVTRAEGNWDELAGKIQKAYGYSKEEAWDEIENFKRKHLTDSSSKDMDPSTI